MANLLQVLVVDDDRSLLQVLLTLLEIEGCRVEAADNPFSALGLLRQHRFDLILADLKMPRMDGLQFLRSAKVTSPDAYVVLMTAYPTAETEKAAELQGVTKYLYKPFKLSDLKQIIGNAAGKTEALPAGSGA